MQKEYSNKYNTKNLKKMKNKTQKNKSPIGKKSERKKQFYKMMTFKKKSK